MTEQQIRELGRTMVTFGNFLSSRDGPDTTGIGIPKIVAQNLEPLLGGKFLTTTELKNMTDELDRSYQKIKELQDQVESMKDMALEKGEYNG